MAELLSETPIRNRCTTSCRRRARSSSSCRPGKPVARLGPIFVSGVVLDAVVVEVLVDHASGQAALGLREFNGLCGGVERPLAGISPVEPVGAPGHC